MIKKIFVILILLSTLALKFGCAQPNEEIVIEEKKETGNTIFKNDKNDVDETGEKGSSIFKTSGTNDDVTVIFFDNDNIVDKDGENFYRPKKKISNTIGSSDCYMVKSGNIELLVDCGYQSVTSYGSITSEYIYVDEFVKIEMQENLLKKIASVMSEDGVLDYLIVTHADYDHIAGLIVDGGLFDCFLNERKVTDLNGREITFTKINYIIDFDSGLVKNFSDISMDKSTRLVNSDYYQAYVYQRDKLIKKGTKYSPASAFFDNDNLSAQEMNISSDNKNIGMPDKIIKRVEEAKKANPDIVYILDENYDNEVDTSKNNNYKDILDSDLGSLKSIESTNGDNRYYYSLKFNNAELRILYNWHYDYIFHSSFNRNSSDPDSTQISDTSQNIYDSQDANNISVCFEVVKDKFKFLSLGDLGGNGENGLLKYYDGTNILSKVSLFKVSHHGSVYNGENSEKLFSICKPKIIVITGCAMYKNVNWKSSEQDPVVSAMVGRTKIKQELFDNISKAFMNEENQPYILCTNINAVNFDVVNKFESVPFYGDIKIRSSKNKLHLSYSYVGKIKAYVSQEWNADYYQKNNKEFYFKTRDDKNKFISFQNTEWFKNIEFIWR